jgi:hypothetical protein
MDRMRSPFRLVIVPIALAGFGFIAGMLFENRSLPHPAGLSGCVSNRQFVTEFRLRDADFFAKIPGLRRESLNQPEATLEIDGRPLGKLSVLDPPIRQFLCEGTHEARLSFPSVWRDAGIEQHEITFLVSRASLFHATQWDKREHEESSCISKVCVFNVGLELSPRDPDENFALEYLEEP